ncbi:DsrE family protein [Marinobacter sp. VGCF2001]|uniref:DsrE family protein n=1 Tax=Marinobacter sp. VGCF2001 TaxID=3417189 RepID=UPI003CE685A0
MTTLLVIDQPPYGSWTGREALDMAFSLAAFDQPSALLFVGAGVNWLCKGQNASILGQKTVEKNLCAAPVFGVEQLLVDARACQQYGLTASELLSGAIPTSSVSETLAQFDQVVFAG